MLAFAASPAITGGPLTAGDFRYAVRQMAVRRRWRYRILGGRVAALLAPDQDPGGRHCSPPP